MTVISKEILKIFLQVKGTEFTFFYIYFCRRSVSCDSICPILVYGISSASFNPEYRAHILKRGIFNICYERIHQNKLHNEFQVLSHSFGNQNKSIKTVQPSQ